MPIRTPFKSGLTKVRSAGRLGAAAVIGFSLTFVAAGIAMLFGLIPQRILIGSETIDIPVLLLFVPLCALTLAILAEVVRAAMSGSFHDTATANPSGNKNWPAGHGEG